MALNRLNSYLSIVLNHFFCIVLLLIPLVVVKHDNMTVFVDELIYLFITFASFSVLTPEKSDLDYLRFFGLRITPKLDVINARQTVGVHFNYWHSARCFFLWIKKYI